MTAHPNDPHRLAYTVNTSTERWRTYCDCRWSSPVVADRRTAHQAHTQHAQEARP